MTNASRIVVLQPKRSDAANGSARRSAQVLSAAEGFAPGRVRHAVYQGFNARDALRGLTLAPGRAVVEATRDVGRGARLAAYAAFLARINEEPELVFWEPHTNPLDAAGPLIRRRWPKARLIAFPHNVEALVPKPAAALNTPRARVARIRRELSSLQAADTVAGISTIDTDVFSLFGLPSVWFPYRPVAAEQGRFGTLRARRQGSEKPLLLILGSASNTPTRLGMEAQFALFETVRRVAPHLQVVMAGRRLPPVPGAIADGIRVFERPSDAALDSLMVEARALWVHQAQTTGALIRVADALFGGIPVLGNRVALQEYRDCPGGYCYGDTPDAFATALVRMLDDGATQPGLSPDPGHLASALGLDWAR
jgi:glycosyltransferase involved in cell wall biosynthesis